MNKKYTFLIPFWFQSSPSTNLLNNGSILKWMHIPFNCMWKTTYLYLRNTHLTYSTILTRVISFWAHCLLRIALWLPAFKLSTQWQPPSSQNKRLGFTAMTAFQRFLSCVIGECSCTIINLQYVVFSLSPF